MADEGRGSPGEGRTIGQFLLAGGVSVLAADVVGLGAGTANHMILARLLRTEQLAAYFLTLSVIEVGLHLVHLGLPNSLTRFIAQARGRGRSDEARGALRAAFPIWLGGALVVALTYAGGFGEWLSERVFGSEIMASGVVVAACWLAFQGSAEFFAGVLRGFRRVGAAAWLIRVLGRVAMMLVLLVWYVDSGSAEFIPVLWLAAGAASLGPILALFVVRRELHGGDSVPIPRALLLRSALPLLVTGLVNIATTRADLWTVGVLFDPGEVAVYGAAKRLIALISFPLTVLSLVVPPIVAELYATRDIARLQGALRGAATLVGIPAIAAVGVLSLGSEEVLGLAFGPSFRTGGVILALLSLERVAFVWVGSTGIVLTMTGHERVLMSITLGASLFTVFAVITGGHLFGFPGVAGGFALASSLQQLATWIAVRRTTGLRTDMDLANLRFALDALKRALGGLRG